MSLKARAEQAVASAKAGDSASEVEQVYKLLVEFGAALDQHAGEFAVLHAALNDAKGDLGLILRVIQVSPTGSPRN
jgi:hypothetical protein